MQLLQWHNSCCYSLVWPSVGFKAPLLNSWECSTKSKSLLSCPFNNVPKQETCIIQCNSFLGMLVTSWDLYDSFNVSEIEPTSKAEGSRATTGKSNKSHTTKEHNQAMLVSSNRGNIFPDLHFCHVFILLNHVYHYGVWWKLHEENAWSACLHLKESLLKNLGQVCTETFSVQCHHKWS